ncbi:D-inositol-3-phosphate glycosyltransferase [Prochlorococcus marinus str. MIT 1313]|uniref:glycosyltransferase n=1 Tax=Prochlorococcus TaxID=1218 RepID=UPI0007B397A5|nr:glycosyltransferase [Prochlorococcus marinus]KZR70224.1 D-inositol-3-phosphate glycosyltransferase [Prochlorococcus marinus str. MIT 1313]KZR70696.1 D-inositol-3-phosphate glycosyltransferase [Prochlorococcus marinus str. MIT 1318]
MRILFVHCNYPAQFRHLSCHFSADRQHEVVFLSQNREWTATDIEGLRHARYQLGRDPQGDLCHPYLRRYETAVLHGQAALREAMRLNQQGFVPDLIVGHSGFGNTLYLKEVWPKAKFIGYFEWYYNSRGSDVGFGSKQPPSPDTSLRVHTYNSPIMMDLAKTDGALCPTHWQAAQFPKKVRGLLNVVFDGIDVETLQLFLPEQRQNALDIRDVKIPAKVPLVTYVTRCFEPYRGWPQVAEGLATLLQRNPRTHILLVGSDNVAYGAKRGDGLSWREWALKEWSMDPSRLHILPALQYEEYLSVLRRSWVHVYWTVPFIVSWSLMESLSSGCCVVASSTPPVQEMIETGKQGMLVDFFNPEALAQQVDQLLNDEWKRRDLGIAARQSIINKGYDLNSCLKAQLELIDRVMAE